MSYVARAVSFDGTNALMIASLAATDNSFFSFAGWIKVASANWKNVSTYWVCDSEGNFTNTMFPHPTLAARFDMADSTDANQLDMQTSNNTIIDDKWTFLIGTADTNLGLIKMQNQNGDVSNAPILNNSPFTMSFNGLSFWFMGDSFGAFDYVNACVSDTSFWPGISFLTMAGDIDPAIRALFIDADKRPVDPSIAVGALGTPVILFSGDATTYATNQGNGGAFTLVGDALTNCASAPGQQPYNYGGSCDLNMRHVRSRAPFRQSIHANDIELAERWL